MPAEYQTIRKPKFTAKFVESVKPSDVVTDFADGAFPGLTLRVTPKGRKTWTFRYRRDGKQKRVTLGHFPEVGLAAAYEAARAEQRGENAPVAATTVDDVFNVYIKRHLSTLKDGQDREATLRKWMLAKWSGRKLAEVTKGDVRALIDSVTDAGYPVQANRVLTYTRAFLRFAMDRDFIGADPSAGIKKQTAEAARDRVLSDDEIKAVWKAAGHIGYPGGTLIQMLLLTGQRRDEVRLMTWGEVDLDNALWTLPAERAKNKQAHKIPLSPPVLRLLDGIVKGEGDWVFCSNLRDKPYANVQRPKTTVDRLSGVTGWNIHDLRRTAATGMGEMGIPGETIARVLNHSARAIGGVTARYERSDRTEEKRAALDAWAAHVTALVGEG
jgi:integrase